MSIHQDQPDGLRTIDRADLSRLLDEPDVTIVDVRPTAAYNGWRLNDERRGGHVPGAVSFPNAWLHSLDEAEIQRQIDEKRIGERRTVVVYGHDAWDAWTFALRLEARGHAVLIFEAGWADWSADENLPVERLPRYDRLIHTAWLNELIAGGRPEGYAGNR